MLGLDSKKVLLVDHDDKWKSFYNTEAMIIKKALDELIIDIQHIGSTSIEGLKAKPIIDILVGLESFEKIDEVIKIMENLGYVYAHWAGIPGDYTFRKGEITTHLIHVVKYGENNWNHNIKFREILKNNPDLIKQYVELKEELAIKHPDSREKYTEGKSEFILKVTNTIK